MRWISLLLFCVVSNVHFAQTDPIVKKLGAYKSSFRLKDTSLVISLNRMAGDSSFLNPERSLIFSRRGLEIAKSIEYIDGECSSLLVIATAKVYSNQFDSALYYANKCYSRSLKTNKTEWKVRSLEMLGNINSFQENYTEAISYLLKASKIAEPKRKDLLPAIYCNIGYVFDKIESPAKSEEYCKKALKMGKIYKDTGALMTAYNILGLLHKFKDTDQALSYYEAGLKLAEEKGHANKQSELLYNMSNVYFRLNEEKKAINLLNKSIEVSKNKGSNLSIALSYHGLVANCLRIQDYKTGFQYADSTLKYAYLCGNFEVIVEANFQYSELLAETNRPKESRAFLLKAYDYKDSMNLAQVNGAVVDAEAKYESEKKDLKFKLEKEHDKKVADEKIKSRELLLWLAGLALLLFVVAAFVLRKQNQKIKAKSIQVEEQKAEIENQHQEITESIRYAQRIQTSLLPDASNWGHLAQRFSLFFQPRNVVSGDFYWAHCLPDNRTHFFAVADCTGHGVPGSLVSMLAISALNELLNLNPTVDTNQLLNELRGRIISGLTKDDQTAKDGLDIALCKYDSVTRKLEFSGANNNLWLIRKEENGELELKEFAGDRMPIGHYFKIEVPFSKHEIQLQEGDQIILYTDGFADQFGGDRSKKYKYGRLKDLLLHYKKSNSQRISVAELQNEFEAWRGEIEQTDDVCLLILDV